MKGITYTADEMEIIATHGELCEAVAREAMKRNAFNFDDIEAVNGHRESHRWGSDTDRKYRKAAVNKAIRAVAANPLKYAEK